MPKLTPYLLFDGNCAEAMAFYQSCVGGELAIMKVSDSPMKDQMPAAVQNKVINARLVDDAIELSASDWMHPTRTRQPGNTVCLYLGGGTYEETKAIFDKLSAEADPALLDPLTKTFFGFYGALTDKYGVRWMFQGE
jgi:PhnB protein